MLRTPVTRRGSPSLTSNRVPTRRRVKWPKTLQRPSGASCLIDAQVSIDLPRRHMPDVVVPLFALRRHEMLEKVFAESVAHERVLFELVERFAQVPGELVDAQVAALP